MASKVNAPFVTFSGGEIGREALRRVQLESYSACAEVLENWLPEMAGPMQIRPGLEFKVGSPGGAKAWLYPFDTGDSKYLVMFTNNALRIVLNGGIIVRSAVGASTTNGDFSSLTGWTDIDEVGGVSSLNGGQLSLVSNGTALAGRRQQMNTPDPTTTHAIEVNVARGPVYLAVGSTPGGSDYIERTELRTGLHSLAFVPTAGVIYVDITSTSKAERLVESIQIASAGDLVLTTPWADTGFTSLRFEQSADVLWIMDGVSIKKRLERRGDASWSLVDGAEADGPFLTQNVDEGLTIQPSVTTGNGTLTASRGIFAPGHVGALFELTHSGQRAVQSITAANTFTDPLKITGVGTARNWVLTITNTFSATWTIQKSVGNTTSWTDVSSGTTTQAAVTQTDSLDNQTVYYRVGVKTGNFTSGTLDIDISATAGVTSGIVRVTGYTSSTVVSMEVLNTLAATTATTDWAEGSWSDAQYWPKAAALFDGRFWPIWSDRFAGSVSDVYESYDTGDLSTGSDGAAAINRALGSGRINTVQWVLPLARLIIGTGRIEVELRSGAFDEAITNTNLTAKPISGIGSANVAPIAVDTTGVFVAKSRITAYELSYDVQVQRYVPRSLMRLNKNLGRPGIVQMAIARQPDTRIFLVRSDGQVLVKIYEPGEAVSGWSRIITDGVIESVAVLPAVGEDEVYFMVRRTVDGETVRYLEKLDSLYYEEASDTNILDSFVRREGAPTTTITGLEHLEGREVVVWADGAAMEKRGGGAFTVVGGQITLPKAKSIVSVGLPYTARYKSVKLAFGAQAGTALLQKGKPVHIILDLEMSSPVIEYGPDFDNLDQLGDRASSGETYDAAPGLRSGETDQFAMPGGLKRDPRLCLQAQSPFPARIAAYVIGHQLNERT